MNEINILIDTKNILSKIDAEKIIVTNYNFFNSLLNNQFASPNKWYDELSIPNKINKYYNVHKNFFLDKINKNKIKHIFFIGKKNETFFFQEMLKENECIVQKQLNELLLEFNISKCEF